VHDAVFGWHLISCQLAVVAVAVPVKPWILAVQEPGGRNKRAAKHGPTGFTEGRQPAVAHCLFKSRVRSGPPLLLRPLACPSSA
jgi:hypothetical protein